MAFFSELGLAAASGARQHPGLIKLYPASASVGFGVLEPRPDVTYCGKPLELAGWQAIAVDNELGAELLRRSRRQLSAVRPSEPPLHTIRVVACR